jgi:hypothetical protein
MSQKFPKNLPKTICEIDFPKNFPNYMPFEVFIPPRTAFTESYMSVGKLSYSQKGKLPHSLSFFLLPSFSHPKSTIIDKT